MGFNKQGGSVRIGRIGVSFSLAIPLCYVYGGNETSESIDR